MSADTDRGLPALYWRMTRGHRKALALGALAHLAINLMELLPPVALGLLIDSASGRSGRWSPALLAGAYIGVQFLQGMLRYPLRMGFVGTATRIAAGIRNEYAERLLVISRPDLARHPIGDLVGRTTMDLGALEGALSTGLTFLLDCLIYLMAIPAVMIWISPELSVWALPVLPAIPILASVLIPRISRVTEDSQQAYGRVMSRTHENVAARETVRAYGLEKRESEAFRSALRNFESQDLRRVRLESLFAGAVQILIAVSMAVVLGLGGRETIERHLSLGRFVTFVQYTGMLAWPLTGLSWAFLLLRKGAAGHGRLREILELPVQARAGGLPLPVSGGAVEIRNLTFAYPGSPAPVLAELSLSIKPGERVAILGPLGAGKSTLLDLLVRAIDPPPRTVWIDGLDVTTVDPHDLRDRIAMAPQDHFLFSGTVRENIAIGSGDTAVLEEAAEAALVQGEEFSHGLETSVGQKGTGLSGGQRQRVAIARALARRASILLLDDAGSALDRETEEKLFKRLGPGTVVFSTHRMSLARQASRIVMLDGGRLVEQGTAEELLAVRGLFWNMARKQAFPEAFDEA